MSEGLLIALLTGIVSGLISWGGVRVQLRYLSRDLAVNEKSVHNLKNENAARKIETHLLAQKVGIELPHD